MYAAAGKYASLFFFIALALMLLPYLPELIKKERAGLLLIVLTGALTMLNLILVHSNKGAVLIPSDLALLCLVCRIVKPGEKILRITAAAGSVLTVLWYPAVKWSYNFNMAGLTFMLFMMMGILYLEYAGKERKIAGLRPIQILMYITALFYATLYHSRCAMAGILVFGISLLLSKRILRSRALYAVICCLLTFGSIVFTALYAAAGRAGINVRFLYKDLLSGRQDIWSELWDAFLRHPFTGIGSSYELKSFEIFEVHNGLFDILVVHGVIVFLLVVIQLLTALRGAGREYSTIRAIAVSAVFGMLAASFFENFFTVPPYSAFFLCFLFVTRPEDGRDADR